MLLLGLQKLTLLDYPDKMACTVFTGGCNFRCPFCHNASLVVPERVGGSEALSEDEFFSFLSHRRGILEGVCVSGGEPTLHADLPDFLGRIKALGFCVKLDTNGYRPEMLRRLIEAGLVDFVAMDIKNSRESYGKTVGISGFDVSPIEMSVEILKNSGIPFEFRTTLVRGLHTPEDLASIGRWIGGVDRYFLQTFKDSGDILSSGLDAFQKEETEALAALLYNFIPNAQIRG